MPSPSDLREAPEARVLRQLVEALLFERVVAAEARREGEATRFAWSAGGRDYRCLGRVRGFGRIRVEPSSIEARGPGQDWRPASLTQIVATAADTGWRAATLLRELERTVRFCRWNADHLPDRPRRALDFRALDGALDEGHPYHPCFKARGGFGEDDHAAFGPEAGAAFRLHWLAVRRDLIRHALPVDEGAFWRAELGETAARDLAGRRAARGLAATDFAFMPIHPWQWRALERGGLEGPVADGAIHHLGEAGPRYVASQSVRTLHNADEPLKSSVKLSMSMANTSSLRTIEPHSVCVAPALSRWLGELVAGDPALAGRVSVLQEYAGLVVDREGPLAGQIAAIWRESAESCLAAGERAVPFNALMATEADGRLFAEPWLARYGASAWAERLIEVVVAPVWRLIARHGVALEAHGQNMVLVHRDGWPERLVLRDFHDSLEYAPDFLREGAAFPDLAAVDPVYAGAADDRFHRMGGVEELRALVMDSLFVFCLSDLAEALERTGALREDAFWRIVSARLSRLADEAEPARLARLGWRAKQVAVERLLAPKLAEAAERFVAAPNVFAERQRAPRSGEKMIDIDDKLFDRAEFDALSGRFAGKVGLGSSGEALAYAVCLPETADWLALFFAIREAGASVLPIHPATPYAAARRLATRAGCDRLAFGPDAVVETLEPETPPTPGVLMQMSSGTTGAPKCVARFWDEIERELDAYVTHFAEPNDMTPVVACPTTHSYGLICGVLAGLKRGRSPKIVNAQNPKRLIRTLKETERPLLYSSPAVLHTLSLLLPPEERIHAAMTSGTVLPGPWFSRIREKSGRLFQQYGCSEAGCVAVNPDCSAPDEMGAPLPHLSVTAGASREAPDEIVVTGPRGPILTRDLGFLANGGLVFLSRLDDTINVSGLNVYPGEVEDAAMAHPAVADAVAFRIADPFAGERVGLAVSGDGPIDEAVLRDWCRENLAAHQVPAEIVEVDAVPRQANGKISRREVAALHAERRLARTPEAAR